MIAGWAILPSAYRLRLAHHLASSCPFCWLAIEQASFEPLQVSHPLLRAAFRALHLPRVDLSLGSQSLCLLTAPGFDRGRDLPRLVLEETLAQRRPDLDFVLSWIPFVRSLLPDDVHRGLIVRISSQQAALLLSEGKVEQALRHRASAVALASMGTDDPASKVYVKMIEFRHAVLEQDPTAVQRAVTEVYEEACRSLIDRPVQRFEILLELSRSTRSGSSGNDYSDVNWAMAELGKGAWGHEAHRLSGLYHKARFALSSSSHLAAVAAEYSAAREGVELCGDPYSRALYQCLLGQVRADLSQVHTGLKDLANLGLRKPFLENTASLGCIVNRVAQNEWSDFVAEVAMTAFHAFGRQFAHDVTSRVHGLNEAER